MSGTTGRGRADGPIVVPVRTPTSAYDVHVGAGALDGLGAVARAAAGGGRCCVISDTNVAPLWAAQA